MKNIFTILLLFINAVAFSQAGGMSVSPNGSTPDPSAILDVSAPNKGFLMPRLTRAQRDSITAPALGLAIFNTTDNCYEGYGFGNWQTIACLCTTPPSAPSVITGNNNPCATAGNVNYSVGLVLGTTSYTWSVPADATIVAGQGTNAITVNFGSLSGNLGVTANNSCGASPVDTLPITLSTGPATPGQISGSDSVIPSSAGNIYSIMPVSGALSYNWTVPVGATITANTGTSITVTFGANVSDSITISATNACGTSPQSVIPVAPVAFNATGGVITQAGGHIIYTFTGSGTLSVIGGGTVSYLIVGGGGGGGDGNAPGGGGGAGGFVTGTIALATGNYPIVVGAGGTGMCCDQPGQSGGNSSFNGIVAYGGGNGGGYSAANGGNGGSGGGGSGPNGCGVGGNSTQNSPPGGTGYGNSGGSNGCSSGEGGGGGGAGGAGGQPNGGTGMASNISGGAVYYAGGGGGGDYPCGGGNTQGIGGTGGGGNGGIGCGGVEPTGGTPNTGGGGGGSPDQTGGNGGSGIVIISY